MIFLYIWDITLSDLWWTIDLNIQVQNGFLLHESNHFFNSWKVLFILSSKDSTVFLFYQRQRVSVSQDSWMPISNIWHCLKGGGAYRSLIEFRIEMEPGYHLDMFVCYIFQGDDWLCVLKSYSAWTYFKRMIIEVLIRWHRKKLNTTKIFRCRLCQSDFLVAEVNILFAHHALCSTGHD